MSCSIQESKGIRQWPLNLNTSPMIIHKIIPSINIQLVVETYGYYELTSQTQ